MTLGSQTKIRRALGRLSSASKSQADDIRIGIKSTLSIVGLLVTVIATGALVSLFIFYPLDPFSNLSVVTFFITYSLFSVVMAFVLGSGQIISSSICSALATSVPLCLFVAASYIQILSWEIRLLFASVSMAGIILWYRGCYANYLAGLFELKREYLVRSFQENLALAPNSLFDKVFSQADKIIVGAVFGIEELAIYALGAQVSNVLYLSMKAFTVYAEAKIFSSSSGRLGIIIGGAVFGVGCSVVLYGGIHFAFDYLFDEEFRPVLSILPWQIALVLIRALSGTVFILDYTEGNHLRNSATQYASLAAGAGLFVVFHDQFTMYSFCVFLFALSMVALAFNILLRFR